MYGELELGVFDGANGGFNEGKQFWRGSHEYKLWKATVVNAAIT